MKIKIENFAFIFNIEIRKLAHIEDTYICKLPRYVSPMYVRTRSRGPQRLVIETSCGESRLPAYLVNSVLACSY